MIGDPDDGAQQVRRFSMRHGRLIETSRRQSNHYVSFVREDAFFCLSFLDSRLRRSPFGPASPFVPQAAQCTSKEKFVTRQRESL